jgi:serine/threonine protein kinase
MKQSPGPSVLSREEFVANLGNSGLFSGDELTRVLAVISPPPDADGPAIARQLTAAGKLTPFQAESLLIGRIGDLLLGNYEVLARLGAGGMGTVFKARHRRMKRVVALKVLARNVVEEGTFLQRFQREVETVARLSHPNIVMAYDADEAESGPFLVMEFVNGRDLASRVQEHGPMPLAEAVDCILQSARGLAYAHGQGIVHRDVKPANLLRDESGVVKVADLGLARLSDTVSQTQDKTGSLTQAGSVVGTVDFMAPEQAEDSTTIDHRADVYSLGCTLYFLLAAKPPFIGHNLMATLMKHRQGEIPSLRAVRPETPPILDALFQSMLAKQPGMRCSSMAEVVRTLEALQPLLPSIPPATRPAAPSTPIVGDPTVAIRNIAQLADLAEQQRSETIIVGQAGPADDRPSTQIPVLGTLSVVLVEPSRTQAVIVRKYLQDLGIEKVVTAPSGQKALEAIAASPPQILICAMHLNDMRGVQLAQKVRSDPALANIGFILVSSEGDSIDVNTVLGYPRTVLLRKPFDLEQLKRTLRQASR